MIAIANEIACKRPGCTHPVIQPSVGHRRREYCSDACKMKDQRRKLAEQQQAHEVELAYELNQLRGERDILQVQVRSLSGQVKRLQSALSQLEQEAVRSRDSVHRIEQYAMACSLGEQQAKEELTKAQSALSQLEQEAACRPQV